ncbi:MAG TPA: META domain-containing protein [Sphingobacteriaceae bacterium]|nr:META domain-containing protein [Sphingobacteriaceae bacterium]
MKHKYLLLLIPFLSFSCTVLDQTADRPVLGGIKWTLSAIEGKMYNLGDKTTIEFDIKEHTAKGKAACNGFSADYEPLTDSRISFVNVTSTKMFCDGLMDIEQDIMTHLRKIKRYEIKADKLYLYGEANLLLTFKR